MLTVLSFKICIFAFCTALFTRLSAFVAFGSWPDLPVTLAPLPFEITLWAALRCFQRSAGRHQHGHEHSRSAHSRKFLGVASVSHCFVTSWKVLWHLVRSRGRIGEEFFMFSTMFSSFQWWLWLTSFDMFKDWKTRKQQNYWLKIKISPLVTAGHHFITSAVARMVRMLRPGAPLKWNRETEVFPSKRKLLGVSDE